MIQPGTRLQVADNTGAKVVEAITILRGTRHRYARIGDAFVASVKEAEPRKLLKKGEIVRCLVVRQRAPFRRKDGTYIKFDDNAVVVVDTEKKEPIGGRVFGPIPREVGERGYTKIASLAPEVV